MKTNSANLQVFLKYTQQPKGPQFSLTADITMEEREFNTAILSVEKTHSSLLLLHLILHNSSFNHVRPGGQASSMGDLLYTCIYVIPQHSSCPEIFSFSCSIPSF